MDVCALKILLLSFYYQPDLCAGSFRTTALVKALLERMPEGASIELITTLPNRYSTYASDAPELEVLPRLTVHRVALSAHKSGVVDQGIAFLGYAKSVVRLIKDKDFDLVVATSSRLMTAALSALVARRMNKPLYLDVRDIFVDTISDVFPKKVTWLATPLFSLIERWTMRQANIINLVSAGFLPYFKRRYPDQKLSFFTNGIDDEFIEVQPTEVSAGRSESLKVVYAGNFGEGQGLHVLIPQLAVRFRGRLSFVLIGDGGRKQELIDALRNSGCDNVELMLPVKRDQLINVYKDADILFLHLNDYDAFRKVLPSKIFEYAAMGKPIWAGVAGYAAEFIDKHVDNSAVFSPCNASEAEAVFSRLDLHTRPRNTFVERFSRANIMNEMAEDICAVLEKS